MKMMLPHGYHLPGFDHVVKAARAHLVYCCCISSLIVICITIWTCPDSLRPAVHADHGQQNLKLQPDSSDPLQNLQLQPDSSDPLQNLQLQPDSSAPLQNLHLQPDSSTTAAAAAAANDDPCAGKRIYMYDLPARFNFALLERCGYDLVNWIDFCPHMKHYGFGQQVSNLSMNIIQNSSRPSSTENYSDEYFSNEDESLSAIFGGGADWYGTDAYMLEVIFQVRMRSYRCLTSSRRDADAFFVPFFAGLDALPYLYTDKKLAATQGPDLVAWLRRNATDSWTRHGGRDHFLVAGRTAWDFSRPLDSDRGNWGTSLLVLPELANITGLVLESRKWAPTDQAVPYPTGFHPRTVASLRRWTETVRGSSRDYLFAFSGALRPSQTGSIRSALYSQCVNASSARNGCSLLDCGKINCSHNPVPIYSKLLRAEFCLQPRGDTATRRSVFDSIIAGCIPVLFHEDTAYTQYSWHLPITRPETFSVFIPEEGIRNGSVLVEQVLRSYSPSRIRQMREVLITLIPGCIYRHPSSHKVDDAGFTEQFRDAFDLSVDSMLQKVASFKSHPSTRG